MSGSVDVAGYYDSNTRRFMLAGPKGGVHSMHRELWAPGVTSSRAAADHINRVLADEITRLQGGDLADADAASPSPTILDFGCGVGGTLFHFARRFPKARLIGVTVSDRQVSIARRLAGELGLRDRCDVRLEDFQTMSLDVRADAIVAVESLAHSERASTFLRSAARHLRPGGHLLVADDFLAREEGELRPVPRRVVDRFRAGWRVPAVCTEEHLLAAAGEVGFVPVQSSDLTDLTRPGSRMRDRLVAAVSPLLVGLGLERVPLFGNLVGGHALQVGLKEGFLSYRMIVLRRVA